MTGGRARPLAFGVVLLPGRAEDLRRWARVAENGGFDLIGLGDSQMVAREVFASLAVLATVTERARVGPTVTNLKTRHVAVTASAIATIDEISGGRAFLGLGSGDSALRSLGLRSSSVGEMEDGVRIISELTAGGSADFASSPGALGWARRRVPILLTAEGPRMLELAGEVADGVILGGGVDTGSLRRMTAAVAAGRERAGRRHRDVETWSFVKLGLGATRDEALEPIKNSLAAAANHAFRGGFEGKDVLVELVPAIRALRAAYAYADHDQHGGANDALTDRFGLTDWLAGRFAVAGTATDCIDQLRRIADTGVDGVLITALLDDPVPFLEEFSSTVLGPYRALEADLDG